MRFGILPRFRRDTIVDPDWVAAFAQVAEEEGADSVWAVEHAIVAEDYEPLYPYSEDGQMPGAPDTVMPDPLEWLAFVAAITTRVRLVTGVMVVPQHPPAVLAKRVATLDALSGGRVELGVGIGWQREEYAAVGVPYERRGARLDEHIDAMRALWGPGPSTYHGEFVNFERVHSDPKPTQPGGVPIVIGGSTEAAARRCGLRGDGFYPYVISPEDLRSRLDLIRRTATEAGRDPDAIQITVWPGSYHWGQSFDLDLVKRYAELGIDRLVLAAEEAPGPTIDELRRLIADYRDKIASQVD